MQKSQKNLDFLGGNLLKTAPKKSGIFGEMSVEITQKFWIFEGKFCKKIPEKKSVVLGRNSTKFKNLR